MDDHVERLEGNLPAVNDQILAQALNAFATSTVILLNRASSAAEGKLAKAEARLREAETRAAALEATLGASSTSGRAREASDVVSMGTVAREINREDDFVEIGDAGERVGDGGAAVVSEAATANAANANAANANAANAIEVAVERAPEPEANAMVNDPVYGKYYKMIKMGVPVQAVRNKMSLDGVDASVLRDT